MKQLKIANASVKKRECSNKLQGVQQYKIGNAVINCGGCSSKNRQYSNILWGMQQ